MVVKIVHTSSTHTCGSKWGKLDVHKLWEYVEGMESSPLDLSSIREMDMWRWEENPTHASFLEHLKRVLDADLSYPVIMDDDGNVLDGIHRICKALLEERPVRCIVISEVPPECQISR